MNRTALAARDGLAYGLLGLPLAFVALPLYVQWPAHYAAHYGVPLASLGALLLAVRSLDAVLDPSIGRAVDRVLRWPLRRRLALAAAGAAALALGFQGLFLPPPAVQPALLPWGAAMLVVCTLAYSGLGVLHQAWGAALGGPAPERARIVAWREGAALAGVVVASALPGLAGLQASSVALAALLALGLAALALAPSPHATSGTAPGPRAGLMLPWQWPDFRRLMAVYLLNGIASALPATLVLFFIRDRLQWPAAEPWLLGAYFLAAGVSLPLWVRGVGRIGLARSWALGMLLSVVAFIGAVGLGAGDGPWFLLVCLASGAALGADLCAPAALLAGVLQRHGRDAEGVAFGWWNAATKLNLAAAAGLSLPLLQALGYRPGVPTGEGADALALVYAVLPCVLKALALAALWFGWIRRETSS
jgi:Na+/melibiose symporter-like transporter